MDKSVRWDDKIIYFINSLKKWQVYLIFISLGFIVFFSGLTGGWQGDDTDQIIKNEAVHSISNIGSFLTSSTFWNGEQLVGDFYRPTMTITYSIIYTIFGANPTAFHIVQLIIYCSAAFILFLIMKKFFKTPLALLFGLIFLVHPINSQIVYSIPSMQEPLMLIFGLSALYLLTLAKTTKDYLKVTGLLFLSLLSKETAIVFVLLSIIYLIIYNREKTKSFLKMIIGPVILYIILRISVVGFRNITNSAPIDFLNFWERMITIPSLVLFYLGKFFWPQNLATSYYWTHKAINLNDFVWPLLICIVILAAIILLGRMIYKTAGQKNLFIYIFFSLWLILGMGPHMQIIALDMTACETWFVIPISGMIGMIFISIRTFLPKIRPAWLIIPSIIFITILGIRSELRGFDFKNQEVLSKVDIRVTEKNYLAMNNLAKYYINHNELKKAEYYAQQSINFFPAVTNYNNLGVARQKMGDYIGAKSAYMNALSIVELGAAYENVAIVNLIIGDSDDNITFIQNALKKYPNNNRLWTYLAIEQAAVGNHDEAKNAILNAYRTGSIPPALYESIMNKTNLDIPITGSDKVVHIKWN